MMQEREQAPGSEPAARLRIPQGNGLQIEYHERNINFDRSQFLPISVHNPKFWSEASLEGPLSNQSTNFQIG